MVTILQLVEIYLWSIYQISKKNRQSRCFNVSNQQNVIETNIYDQMTDKKDGTYTYNLTVSLNGTISIHAIIIQAGMCGEYFGNVDWNDAPEYSN